MRRYRAVTRAEPPGPPQTSNETRLEDLQMRLTRALHEVARLTAERDDLALRMWLDQRIPQAEIAERLDRADRRAGGEGVSYAAIQKRAWRARNAEALTG